MPVQWIDVLTMTALSHRALASTPPAQQQTTTTTTNRPMSLSLCIVVANNPP